MATRDGDSETGQPRLGHNHPPPDWRPKWGPHEAWARGFVKTNQWRVDRLLTYEEAVQECALIYVRCCRFYEGKVDNPKWFMALFKRAVERGFHTFSLLNNRQIELCAEDAITRPQIDFSDGPLYAALSKASDELKDVLRVLATAPSELMYLMLDGVELRRSKERDAALSRSLCRLARVANIRSDLLIELRTLLEA